MQTVTTRAGALSALAELTPDLAAKRRELGELLAAEHEGKVQTWFNAHDVDSVSGRDRLAEYHTLHLTPDILKLRGEILALEDEREYYTLVLHWGGA